MRYKVTHVTAYTYEDTVAISHNEARMTPRRTPTQIPHRSQILVEPAPTVLVTEADFFGNTLHFFSLEEGHTHLRVTSVGEVEVAAPEPVDPNLTPEWEQIPELLRRDSSKAGLAALGYTFESQFVTTGAGLADYARESFTPGRPVLAAAKELTERIRADFRYEPGATSIATPTEEVLAARRGVCQDFAHLEIGMLRTLGLPARYVSGYVRTHPPPGQEPLVGADATHAWVSLYCPGFGYVDLDPTNGSLPTDEHVTVAWGRDFGDVSPLRGVILGGGRHKLDVSVDVAVV